MESWFVTIFIKENSSLIFSWSKSASCKSLNQVCCLLLGINECDSGQAVKSSSIDTIRQTANDLETGLYLNQIEAGRSLDLISRAGQIPISFKTTSTVVVYWRRSTFNHPKSSLYHFWVTLYKKQQQYCSWEWGMNKERVAKSEQKKVTSVCPCCCITLQKL